MLQKPSEFLNEQLRSRSATTIISDNRKWYENTYIKESINPLEIHPNDTPLVPGKIYTFPYDPKYKDRLSFFDNRPINFILGHMPSAEGFRPNAFGINLSFVPPKVRMTILDEIKRVFGTMIINPNTDRINKGQQSLKKMPMTYDLAKVLLQKSGFEFALRSYIYTRMGSKPRIIDYSEWWRLGTFSSDYIRKLNKLSIYWRYKQKLDKADFRVYDKKTQKYGRKEKKILLKNMTIKAVKEFVDSGRNPPR